MTTEMMTNELITAIEALEPEVVGGAFLAIFAIFAVATIFCVIRYLLTAIGYSKMYRKADIAPWKAFIPVYNSYNNYKLSWNGKLFFLYAALTVGSTLLGIHTEGFLALVANLVSLGIIFLAVKQNIKMAKLFGKGAGTGIALLFFPGITSLILGLGKAEFQAELIANN